VQVTPYTLRHTGAVWVAEAGISMAALAQYMGHEGGSAVTEKVYARFSPGYLANVANAVRRKV
jgi:integrase